MCPAVTLVFFFYMSLRSGRTALTLLDISSRSSCFPHYLEIFCPSLLLSTLLFPIDAGAPLPRSRRRPPPILPALHASLPMAPLLTPSWAFMYGDAMAAWRTLEPPANKVRRGLPPCRMTATPGMRAAPKEHHEHIPPKVLMFHPVCFPMIPFIKPL